MFWLKCSGYGLWACSSCLWLYRAVEIFRLWFLVLFCFPSYFFLSQVVVVGSAVVKIFRLWLLVLLWLKFSGYGFGVLFFVFFVRLWSLVFSLAEMFRLWSLVLFSIFLVLFPLLCQAMLVFVRLWSCFFCFVGCFWLKIRLLVIYFFYSVFRLWSCLCLSFN